MTHEHGECPRGARTVLGNDGGFQTKETLTEIR
jgi:hypothetical protein